MTIFRLAIPFHPVVVVLHSCCISSMPQENLNKTCSLCILCAVWLFVYLLPTVLHREKLRPKKVNCSCLFLLVSLLRSCRQSQPDCSCQTKLLFNTVTWRTVPGPTVVALKALITSFSRHWEGWMAVMPGSRLSMAPLSFKLSFPVLF